MAARLLAGGLMLGVALALSSCGVSYISPSVSTQTAGLDVRELPLTAETVLVANRQGYAPRSLPEYFNQVAGGGSLRGVGDLPAAPQIPSGAPEQLELRPPPSAPSRTYHIGTGDLLRLATRSRIDALSSVASDAAAENVRQDYTVRDDGAVTIPEIGVVTLGGMTIEEAEAELFQRFIQAGIDPTFALEVAGFNSQHINVGGAVHDDIAVPVGLVLPSLDDVLTAAGGIQVQNPEFASIRVYRDGTLYQIPLEDYRSRSQLRGVRLADGDGIFVDIGYDLDRALNHYQQQINISTLRRADRTAALNELQTEIGLRRAQLNETRNNYLTRIDLDAVDRDYVYLAGEVSRQSRLALPFERQASLADMLYDNDGFDTATGNPAQIYVLRASPNPADFGAVTAWHLDGANVVNMTIATRFLMRPDDIIFIEEQPITKWNRALNQIFPTLLNVAAAGVTN